MASFSGSYTFSKTNSDQLITDAWERVIAVPDKITAQQIKSAQRSINLILSEWMNRGLNLWTIKQNIQTLMPNQAAYELPLNVSDVLTCFIRTSQRQLGGTPFSSAGGIASNAFNANPLDACTQTSADGYISYDYGVNGSQMISMVGISSFTDSFYTLVLETSFDNVNWNLAYSAPINLYAFDDILWIVIPAPISARAFRVRETGGATLNINELYFNTNLQDTEMSALSYSEYSSMPMKNQSGRPNSYWVNRKINPVIVYIWPTPTIQFQTMYYTCKTMMQDIGSMQDMPDIPQRFFEAMVAELAAKLGVKTPSCPLEKIEKLYQLAEISFTRAAMEDTENVPLRIAGDYSSGYGGD